MGKRWTINTNEPPRTEKYEWHSPNNEIQHITDTTAPGDLELKPKDIALKPTNAPKRSGVQSGVHGWNFEVDPVGSWYVFGSIVQEDD